MSRLSSGWNMPPGCFRVPGDEPTFCEVCTLLDDACICPECPVCHSQGDPKCYQGGSLTAMRLTKDQLKARYNFILQRAESKVRELKITLQQLETWEPGKEPWDLGEELISNKLEDQPDPFTEVRLTYG